MEGTRKLRPVNAVAHARMPGSLLLAVALIAAGLAYVSLLAQPALVTALSGLLRGLPSWTRGPEWVVPVAAGGIAVGGAALCLAVLSAFIRGVQTVPYAWLSPVLVGFSGLVLSRMRIDLPLAWVSPAQFSVLAGGLMLGGGALVQMRGWASKLSGALLLALPLLTLIAGYAHAAAGLEPAWRALDSGAALFLFVLALTCSGVGLVAFVARPSGPVGDRARDARRWQEHREQLAEALERARASEARQTEAERRAQLAEYSLRAQGVQLAVRPISVGRGDDTAEFVALARPSPARLLLVALCMLAAAGAAGAAYFAAYRPLAHRLVAQQAFAAESAKEHVAEVDALRKRFDAERAGLRAALAAEHDQAHAGQARAAAVRAKTDAPPTEAQAAPSPLASAQPARPAELRPAPKTAAKRSARSTQPSHAVLAAAAREKGGVRHAKQRPAADAVEHGHASEPSAQGALKESVNDDPIGGLEGL
jgi:hypothetical protein